LALNLPNESMELIAGLPFWLVNTGLLNHYPKLNADKRTHVAIIGGGISGALAAYHLAQAGISCILVDGRSIGLGSTCASTSLLQYELDTPLHKLIEMKGKTAAVRSYQLCGEAIYKLVSLMQESGFKEFEHNPSLFYSNHRMEKDFMIEEYKARKKAGFDVSFLSASDMKKKYGLQALHGILSATGASVNTYALTHHLMKEAIKSGLEVFDRTRIIQISREKRGMKLTTTEGYHINSKVVLNASGYEITNFIGKRIVNFDCTYALVTEHQAEQPPHWPERTMMWNTDNPYLYMRLTPDNRILLGGRDEPVSNRVTRQLYLQKKARALENDLRKALPGIKARTEFTWSGTFGKTKDSLPYIGQYPKTPGIYYALGFGGNGITFNMVAAEMIRDILTGHKNKDLRLFSFNR
jgi:glycine/D-amino acid oxidase-like deaminating enzyme